MAGIVEAAVGEIAIQKLRWRTGWRNNRIDNRPNGNVRELRMVQDIERFGAELKLYAFIDTPHFGDGKVPVFIGDVVCRFYTWRMSRQRVGVVYTCLAAFFFFPFSVGVGVPSQVEVSTRG